jgi:hypothetical protein
MQPHAIMQHESQLTQKSENAAKERVEERSTFQIVDHARMCDGH